MRCKPCSEQRGYPFKRGHEALGPTRTAAPFYRPPYLSMTKELERYINASGMMVWSIDADRSVAVFHSRIRSLPGRAFRL